MPYPNGNPTGEEHAAKARQLLTPGYSEGDHLDHFQCAVVDAVRGVGHALLALVDEHEAHRLAGRD